MFGVHLPNFPRPAADALAEIASLRPRLLVVCQPDFSLVPELRRLCPEAIIVGRVFVAGGVSAWHPPYDKPAAMRSYGRACRELAESAGIDVCQSPLEADLHAERAVRGMRVDVAPNPTRRGERRVLTLDPGIAHNTRLLVERLCAELGIPMQAPRGPDGRVRHDVIATSLGELGNFSGVVGHHHVNSSKWDVAPWWGALFAGTPLGD